MIVRKVSSFGSKNKEKTKNVVENTEKQTGL